MKKNKVYVIEKEKNKVSMKSNIIEFIFGIISYSIILLIAGSIFKGFYVENFLYAVCASLIISFLNFTIKPVLVYFSLPITIMSMGLFYPIINVVILKLTSLIMGSHFRVEGIIVPIFIALFISFLRIIFNIFINSILGDK